VDEQMLTKGTNRLKSLTRGRRLNPNQRAYLLYSLALAGVKYESMLKKLSGKSTLSEYGKALLAMALLELGMRESALELTGQIDLAVHQSPQGTWWGKQDGPGWEGDPVESTAAVLRALLMMKPDSVNISGAVRWLMSVRDGNHWASTRDTAMAVYALVDYLKKHGGVDYDAKVTVALNDKASPAQSFGKDDVLKPSVSILEAAAAAVGPNTIDLNRQGKGALFYNASISFFGRQEKIPARGAKFRINRKLLTLKKVLRGDRWRFETSPLRGPVKSGDEILVILELDARRDAEYIMVEDPMPAGVQPIDRDQGYAVPGVRLRQPRLHREFHDQHAAFFISSLRKGKRTLAYLVRATLPGSYHIMPARVLPMYDPQFAGNSANHNLKVTE
jgi:uncharacterized protein YfaS (alpha-2-macroglobulin family)